MSVDLRRLMAPIPAEFWQRAPELTGEVVVTGIGHDSRAVAPGDLFCALPGARVDGTRYAAEALERGAAALLVEGDARVPGGGTTVLRARSARRVMALLAALFHGEPSRRLRVIAITGTDGKTSTVWFTRCLLTHCGRRALAAGTLGISGEDGQSRPWPGAAPHSAPEEAARTWQPTTPESPVFQASLAAMATQGVQDVVAEVSSHALMQDRIFGTQFRVVAITHVASDHLDFHGTREAYLAAKSRLFDRATRGGPLEREPVVEVLNLDDELGRTLAARGGPRQVTFGADPAARVRCLATRASSEGIELEVAFDGERTRLQAPLLGEFHQQNLLTTAAIAHGLGLTPSEIAEGLAEVSPVPGRFETIRAGQPFTLIVDYAHTTGGLTNLLRAARRQSGGRLIVVFGCGGDRDRGKRPAMGRVAGELADRVIITSDNPRSEDPAAIAAEVRAGLAADSTAEIVLERRAALARAITLARRGDTLVVAGKGAETLQVFADHVEPFDDRAVLRELLQG